MASHSCVSMDGGGGGGAESPPPTPSFTFDNGMRRRRRRRLRRWQSAGEAKRVEEQALAALRLAAGRRQSPGKAVGGAGDPLRQAQFERYQPVAAAADDERVQSWGMEADADAEAELGAETELGAGRSPRRRRGRKAAAAAASDTEVGGQAQRPSAQPPH